MSFLKTHPPCLATETLTENQSSPKKLAGIPTDPGDLPVSTSPCWDYKHTLPRQALFYVGIWRSNSVLHVCKASILLTEPSPQPRMAPFQSQFSQTLCGCQDLGSSPHQRAPKKDSTPKAGFSSAVREANSSAILSASPLTPKQRYHFPIS